MTSERPILITGASGKTGRRVVEAIARRGANVRAWCARPEAEAELLQAGATEIVLGDLTNPDAMDRAIAGAGQVLHICPPMHPQEDRIAMTLVDLARQQGVERFILHSALHPLLADVPHHARKLEAERALIDSGQPYTILQPSRYMQHLVPIWKQMLATGVHSMPFSTHAKFSVVDLADLAEAAARIATEPGHEGATYQLAGPQALSQDDMADILTGLLGRPIRAAAKPMDEVRQEMAAAGMPAERIDTMGRMNAHYDAHGLVGNPNVLRWILGREPATFADFVRRELVTG